MVYKINYYNYYIHIYIYIIKSLNFTIIPINYDEKKLNLLAKNLFDTNII